MSPSASVNFLVSQVPSIIIAAFPPMKSSTLLVFVKISEFVQPFDLRAAYFVYAFKLPAEFHAFVPLYNPRNSEALLVCPIARYEASYQG